MLVMTTPIFNIHIFHQPRNTHSIAIWTEKQRRWQHSRPKIIRQWWVSEMMQEPMKSESCAAIHESFLPESQVRHSFVMQVWWCRYGWFRRKGYRKAALHSTRPPYDTKKYAKCLPCRCDDVGTDDADDHIVPTLQVYVCSFLLVIHLIRGFQQLILTVRRFKLKLETFGQKAVLHFISLSCSKKEATKRIWFAWVVHASAIFWHQQISEKIPPHEICNEMHANSTNSYLFDKYAVKSMKTARVVLASKNPYFLRSRILANISSDVPSSTAVKPSGPYFPVISDHISDCCDCLADRCNHGLDYCGLGES